MIEQIFKNSRYLVFLTIIVSLLSSVTLYLTSISILFHVLYEFFFKSHRQAVGRTNFGS